VRKIGVPWSAALWRRSRLAAQGTLEAARAALGSKEDAVREVLALARQDLLGAEGAARDALVRMETTRSALASIEAGASEALALARQDLMAKEGEAREALALLETARNGLAAKEEAARGAVAEQKAALRLSAKAVGGSAPT
jgi:hypothetical protein